MDPRKLAEGPWRRLWLMAASLLWVLAGSLGLKITRVQVPSPVQAGDTVDLQCQFELQTDQLYSLTWWREQHQFYQFVPAVAKKKSKYDTNGIYVDEAKSNLTTVVLRNVSLETAGKYKCEVVADFPTFEKDFQQQVMEVIDVPDRIPVLQVERTVYSQGEDLVGNCTSPGARPAPQLQWFINGVEVPKHYSRIISQGQSMKGLLSPTSELNLPLRERHFKEGQIRLTCSASIPPIYHQSSDVVLSRLGFKTVAPSQKLYGTGSVMGVNLVMMLLACLVTSLLLVM
ncbi:cell adhesion molecule 1-like [Panulirus ornatus]|uniref:cell adhesion molecule 1-like n=1 Tax=Panulirus ornatus TaxID=150431 RepID=UPI003A8AF07B